jgi:hypothetical protein
MKHIVQHVNGIGDILGELKMGTIYRYARPYSSEEEFTGELPNYFYVTKGEGQKLPLLERGISPLATVTRLDENRLPAILISSSPHKIGSEGTPWQDTFDVDNGVVRYFGDNKSSSAAALSPGNKLLLDQFRFHTSPNEEERLEAAPIIFFQREAVDGRAKGNVRFQGLGVLQKIELVTQFQKNLGYFTNYVFEFAILSLASENEVLDWNWINLRRDSKVDTGKANSMAPVAYRQWLRHGQLAVEKHTRRVHRFLIAKSQDQLPEPGSREHVALEKVYRHFDGKKAKFEFLASRIVQGIVNTSGGSYIEGWVTRQSSDGGVDFVGRIDIGHGFSKVKIVVLGQAKCESPLKPTSGKDVARTVARLKRGWIGAYVTTGHFSKETQIEIAEDQYPLITVNGKQLAQEVLRQQVADGFSSLEDFLVFVESEYSEKLSNRAPDSILFE